MDEWQKDVEKRLDEHDLRLTLNERDIQTITNKLDKINDNTSKIIWLVVTVLVTYVINNLLKGGIL